MASKEEISMIGFEIVAYAGDAQTDLITACEKAVCFFLPFLELDIRHSSILGL